MNVLVCIKQVPDNAVVPKLDAATNRVVKEGVETMVSPFDLNAVEAGLKLVEEHGGEVSVLSVGDDSCKTTLRIGLSMGAAKAYLVNDPALEDSDTWATSYTLAKAIKYAKEREVFKRPIAKFQGIQWMLADAATQVEAARMLTYYAADLKEQVPSVVKEERAHRAAQVAHTMERRYLESLIGRTLSVLFEQDEDGCSKGHAPNYVEVRVKEPGLHNMMRDATVTGVEENHLIGE